MEGNTHGNEQTNWTKWCANDGHKSVPTGESESCWWIDFEASDFDDPVVTETEDGAFYVFKAENSDFYPLSYLGKSGGLVVTMTSDGLVVTAAENKEFTVAVHDKGDTPTGVENAQTNQVQGTKILRDGMLLIEKNGKIYNVVGTVVR